MRSRHIEIFADRQGGWRWRVVAGNGEIMAASESYTRRYSARRAAKNLYPTLPVV